MAFVDWRQSHQKHVLAVKQQDTDRCDRGVEWVWLYLQDCICGPAQITGWYLVLTAILLLVPTCWSSKTSTNLAPSSYVGLPVLSFLINAISLVGALLSMQMVLVIAYDATAVLVDFVTVLVAVCHRRKDRKRSHYQLISQGQTEPAPRYELVWKVLCFAAFPITLMTLICTMQVVDSLESRRDLYDSPTRTITANTASSVLHDLLMVIGYILGSVACFGQWAFQWNTIWVVQSTDSQNEAMTQETYVVLMSRVGLVLSRGLYVIGVFLQSGGWMVVMVTLPWTVKRGSDTSNVLWDRAWKIPSVLDGFVYYEKAKLKAFDAAALKLMTNNISTNSDWSSSSDEQELEWEDANIAPYNYPRRDRAMTMARMERVMCSVVPSRPLPLTLTIPESSDQRVITWISNSTPEEEKTPQLTMTLNLDSSPKTPNNLSMIGDTSRTHPLPRKYSL